MAAVVEHDDECKGLVGIGAPVIFVLCVIP